MVAAAGVMNPQIRFGEDLMSRVSYVMMNPDGREAMTKAVREAISLLIDAAKITDDIFWLQVWGDKDQLLDSIDDPKAKRFAYYNYGPWDRLADDQPFIESHGPRPPGARFYPEDMTVEEFEAAVAAWENLHNLFLAEGDDTEAARAAAMVAMYLMMDTGLMASVRGWLRRTERLGRDAIVVDGRLGRKVHKWGRHSACRFILWQL